MNNNNELSKSESILNEYIMNTSEISSSRDHIYTHQSINNNLCLKIHDRDSRINKNPFNIFSLNSNNHLNQKENINMLINSIECNNVEKVKEYLDKDSSNINTLNEEGISPLHIAVINGNLEIIKILLKYGANPNIKSTIKNQTPLHLAYIFKSVMSNQIINLLLKNSANPNLEDINLKKPCEYLLKYKESNDIENTLTNENEEIEISSNIQMGSPNNKNIKNEINNQEDSFNDNKNKCTYTISENEATISQTQTKRSSAYYNIKELINYNKKNDKHKRTIKIPEKNEIIINNQNTNNNSNKNKSIVNINNNYFLSKDNNMLDDSLEINLKNDILNNLIYDNTYNNEEYNKFKVNNNKSENKKLFLNTSHKDLRFKRKLEKGVSLHFNSVKSVNKNKNNNNRINISEKYYFNNKYFNNFYTDKEYIKSKGKRKSIKIPKKSETSQNSGMINSMLSTHNQTVKKEKSKINTNKNVSEFIYNDDLYYSVSDSFQNLKNWLIGIELPFYYKNFINKNIFDINDLINEVKIKNNKINYEFIENILKIHKSGHIYRILCKLEIDAGFVENKICNFLLGLNNNTFDNNSKNNKSVYLQSKECFCKSFNCLDNKKPLMEKKDLKTFLRKYNLLHLYDNFYHNGFNLINFVILQMYTKYSINDDIIQKCFRIYKKKDRYFVLDALFNEVKEINIFFSTNIHNYCLFPKYENNDWNNSWNDETINTDSENSNECTII